MVTTTKCYDEIQMSYQIFDGHNDVLFRLFLKNKIDAHEDFLQGDNEGHLDLPRMEEAGFRGGFFAIYVPSPEAEVNSSDKPCLLYTSPSPRDLSTSRMPSSA